MNKMIKGVIIFLFCFHCNLNAQVTVDSISENSISETISILASDSLKGRGAWTPELLKAAEFVEKKFRKAGLYPLSGNTGFYCPFLSPYDSSKVEKDELVWNELHIPSSHFIYIPQHPRVNTPKNLEHMLRILRGIALAAQPMIDGAITPKRIKAKFEREL